MYYLAKINIRKKITIILYKIKNVNEYTDYIIMLYING